MKINSISLISVVSTLVCASAANADMLADFYIGGMAGAGGQTVFADDDIDTNSATIFGAVAGVDLPVFRIEAEYDYFKSSDFDTNAAMLNLYAKMPSTVIMPYIGGGIGMVFGGDYTTTHSGVKYKYDVKSTAAYQAMLGATVDLEAIPVKFDIEGRVLYAPDVFTVTGTDIKPDMLQYDARVKIRYIF